MASHFEYDVITSDGRHLNINPSDLSSARELARSWNGRVVQHLVGEWQELPDYKKEAQEFILKVGDPDDYFECWIVVTAGSVDGEEVDGWKCSMVSVSASIRNHGYVLGDNLGNDTHKAFK